MDILIPILATAAILTTALALYLFLRLRHYRKLEIRLAQTGEFAAGLQTRADELKARLDEAEKEIAHWKQEASDARYEAKETATLAEMEKRNLETRLADWEASKKETIKNAEAAVLSASGKISSKLLEDHKREMEQAKKAAEEITVKNSKNVLDRFETIVKSVASLNDQVSQNKSTVETVWRALTTPGGAGAFAEIGLENTLKHLGLEPGRDFIMQYTTRDESGRTRRPDAIVLLPGDAVMIIDSKSSKFLLELAEAEERGDETGMEKLMGQLGRRMNDHLKELARKDYQDSVRSSLKQADRQHQARRIINVMYLPNESALEKVIQADPEFTAKAARQDIIPTGPTGLKGLIAFAKIEIGMARQEENYDRIVESMQKLMESVIIELEHAEKVGRGLESAARHFDKFAKHANARLLPRLKELARLGVTPLKNKPIPGAMKSYHMIEQNHLVIDGEAEPSTNDRPQLNFSEEEITDKSEENEPA